MKHLSNLALLFLHTGAIVIIAAVVAILVAALLCVLPFAALFFIGRLATSYLFHLNGQTLR